MAHTDPFRPSSWRDVRAEQRIARIEVDPVVLVGILKAHHGDRYYLNTRDPLPDDAVLLEACYHPERGTFGILVGSAAFDPVPTPDPTPLLTPEVTVTVVPEEGG